LSTKHIRQNSFIFIIIFDEGISYSGYQNAITTEMTLKNIIIKETDIGDFNDIMQVEKLAFGYDKEAKLVADLLKDPTAKPLLSLLAFHNNKAVGHILFTRVYLEGSTNQALVHILAPLAIIPESQKKGIGGMLIKEGLKILKARGTELVFVLGHMDYYPKFGFIPDANALGLEAPYPIPEEHKNAWMVQSLSHNGLDAHQGKIRCADQLNKAEHWRE
jgi:putative acetyltransferase